MVPKILKQEIYVIFGSFYPWRTLNCEYPLKLYNCTDGQVFMFLKLILNMQS